jgi:mannose-6-phosphate isomerase-like protein (cupin superfamily)
MIVRFIGGVAMQTNALKTDVTPKAETFSLRTQRISTGKYDSVLARAEELELRLKIYADGGENARHAHLDHDHSFIVLEGQATFYDHDDNPTVVNKFEGIMLPRGTYYRFQCTSEIPLVLLRSGGGERTANDQWQRSVGRPRAGRPVPNQTAEDPAIYSKDAVLIPGKYFGD